MDAHRRDGREKKSAAEGSFFLDNSAGLGQDATVGARVAQVAASGAWP
jgi:hypothetical protein